MQIDAHRSPLAAVALSCNGMYLATASEQGTIVRVHQVSEATKVRIMCNVLAIFWSLCHSFVANSNDLTCFWSPDTHASWIFVMEGGNGVIAVYKYKCNDWSFRSLLLSLNRQYNWWRILVFVAFLFYLTLLWLSLSIEQSHSFRRGTYQSTIFSLAFGPSMQLPDILVAMGSSGSIHVFALGFALDQRYDTIRMGAISFWCCTSTKWAHKLLTFMNLKLRQFCAADHLWWIGRRTPFGYELTYLSSAT